MDPVHVHFRLYPDAPEDALVIEWLKTVVGPDGRLRLKKQILPVLAQEARRHARNGGGSNRQTKKTNGRAAKRMTPDDEVIEFEELPPEGDAGDLEDPEKAISGLYFGSP